MFGACVVPCRVALRLSSLIGPFKTNRLVMRRVVCDASWLSVRGNETNRLVRQQYFVMLFVVFVCGCSLCGRCCWWLVGVGGLSSSCWTRTVRLTVTGCRRACRALAGSESSCCEAARSLRLTTLDPHADVITKLGAVFAVHITRLHCKKIKIVTVNRL